MASSLFCSHFQLPFKLTLPRLDKRRPRAPCRNFSLRSDRGGASLPSCPRLSRASTSFLRQLSEQDVDGRDKPGHDSGEAVTVKLAAAPWQA